MMTDHQDECYLPLTRCSMHVPTLPQPLPRLSPTCTVEPSETITIVPSASLSSSLLYSLLSLYSILSHSPSPPTPSSLHPLPLPLPCPFPVQWCVRVDSYLVLAKIGRQPPNEHLIRTIRDNGGHDTWDVFLGAIWKRRR